MPPEGAASSDPKGPRCSRCAGPLVRIDAPCPACEAKDGKPSFLPAARKSTGLDRVDLALLRAEKQGFLWLGRLLRLGVGGFALASFLLAGALWLWLPFALWGSNPFLRGPGLASLGAFAECLVLVFGTFLASRVLRSLGSSSLRVFSYRDLFRLREDGNQEVLVDAFGFEDTVLGARSGGIGTFSLAPLGLEPEDRVEVRIRILDSEGRVLGAKGTHFRGAAGEYLVQAISPPLELREGPFLDLRVFLPLAPLEFPEPARAGTFRLSAIFFVGGNFRGETRHPIRLDPGRLLPGERALEEALTSEEFVQIESVSSRGPQIAPGSSCQICGGGLELEGELPVCVCSQCWTPHHWECWEFAGRCSTFACQGEPESPEDVRIEAPQARPEALPAGFQAPRRPVLFPKAEDILAGTWRAACPACGGEVDLQDEGRCAACQALVLGPGDFQEIPSRPQSLVDLPVFALGAAGTTLARPLVPLLLGVLALAWGVNQLFPEAEAVALLGLLFLGALGSGATLAWILGPRNTTRILLGPIRRSAALVTRAFPYGGQISFQPEVQPLEGELAWEGSVSAGSLRLMGSLRFLEKDLGPRTPELYLRLRTPWGAHWKAAHPAFSGPYGEFLARVGLLVQGSARPRVRGVSFRIHPKAFAWPAAVLKGDLWVEALLSLDGRVLALWDLRAPPILTGFRSMQVAGDEDLFRAKASVREACAKAGPGCSLCGESIREQASVCEACQLSSHPDCWEFCGACPACGAVLEDRLGSSRDSRPRLPPGREEPPGPPRKVRP